MMASEAFMSDEPIAVVPPHSTDSEHLQRKRPKISCFSVLFSGLVCLILAAIILPNFVRARPGGSATSCKSNLKNLGTGLEMYSTDWEGTYPKNLAILTPEYLKTLPTCPSAGSVTYGYTTGHTGYNTTGYIDYYLIWCDGANHTSIGLERNFPRYDAIRGLGAGDER